MFCGHLVLCHPERVKSVCCRPVHVKPRKKKPRLEETPTRAITTTGDILADGNEINKATWIPPDGVSMAQVDKRHSSSILDVLYIQ